MQRRTYGTAGKGSSKGENVEFVGVGKAGMAQEGCDASCGDHKARSAHCCTPTATRPRIVGRPKVKYQINLIKLK